MARKSYSSEEVAKRMESLPEAAADFLYSSEMGAMVKSISDKYSLHIDQMGLLEAETGQLILGLTPPHEFVPYITESLKITPEQATSIAKDINEQVMSKIRASMGQPSSTTTPQVVMPSSSPKPPLPTPTPSTTPAPVPTPPPAPPVAAKTPQASDLMAAEAILSEKRVTPPAAASVPAAPAAPATPLATATPTADPAQPQNYKADPYREPIQ